VVLTGAGGFVAEVAGAGGAVVSWDGGDVVDDEFEVPAGNPGAGPSPLGGFAGPHAPSVRVSAAAITRCFNFTAAG
jgi:hypothetical protein